MKKGQRIYRVNNQIRMSKVRLISSDGEQLGVVALPEALNRAREDRLDLVEVTVAEDTSVCRIMDYSKFKYEQQKKQRQARKKQKVIHVKEVRFTPNIEEHDYNVKLRHAHKFLSDGNKVKVIVTFRGRQLAHKDRGKELMERCAQDLASIAELAGPLSMEDRLMSMVFIPKSK